MRLVQAHVSKTEQLFAARGDDHGQGVRDYDRESVPPPTPGTISSRPRTRRTLSLMGPRFFCAHHSKLAFIPPKASSGKTRSASPPIQNCHSVSAMTQRAFGKRTLALGIGIPADVVEMSMGEDDQVDLLRR